jgi:hypothetical protein
MIDGVMMTVIETENETFTNVIVSKLLKRYTRWFRDQPKTHDCHYFFSNNPLHFNLFVFPNLESNYVTSPNATRHDIGARGAKINNIPRFCLSVNPQQF